MFEYLKTLPDPVRRRAALLAESVYLLSQFNNEQILHLNLIFSRYVSENLRHPDKAVLRIHRPAGE